MVKMGEKFYCTTSTSELLLLMHIKKSSKEAGGMTVFEIVIVSLIVILVFWMGYLMLPTEEGRQKVCANRLQWINLAKEKWVTEYLMKAASNDVARVKNLGVVFDQIPAPMLQDLLPTFRRTPVCPSGGSYTVGDRRTLPTCSYTHTNSSGTIIRHEIPR